MAAVITGYAAGHALVQRVLMRVQGRPPTAPAGCRPFGLDDPGGHQRLELLISDRVEAQVPITRRTRPATTIPSCAMSTSRLSVVERRGPRTKSMRDGMRLDVTFSRYLLTHGSIAA